MQITHLSLAVVAVFGLTQIVLSQPGAAVFRIGNGVSAPKAIYAPDPEYSQAALTAKKQGTVVLRLIVGADGLPHDVKVVKKLGLGLDKKAIETVRTWRFQPGTKGGQPVATYATIEVAFAISNGPPVLEEPPPAVLHAPILPKPTASAQVPLTAATNGSTHGSTSVPVYIPVEIESAFDDNEISATKKFSGSFLVKGYVNQIKFEAGIADIVLAGGVGNFDNGIVHCLAEGPDVQSFETVHKMQVIVVTAKTARKIGDDTIVGGCRFDFLSDSVHTPTGDWVRSHGFTPAEPLDHSLNH